MNHHNQGMDKLNEFKCIALTDNCVWIRRIKETKKSKKFLKKVIN